MRELIAADHPEKKERVLAFLREHPITELLQGDRYMQAGDVDRWKIRFIFDDPGLNRTIEGYGRTELTDPYLSEMCGCLPRILSKEEQAEEVWRQRILESQMRQYTTKEQPEEKP